MTRRVWAVAVIAVAVLVGVGWLTRPAEMSGYTGPSVTVSVPATSLGPTAPQLPTPADARPFVELAQTFTTLWLAHKVDGSPQWLEALRVVASEDLALATASTVPDDIPDARLGEVLLEAGAPDGGAVIVVELRNGSRYRMVAAPVGGAMKIVSVENAKRRL